MYKLKEEPKRAYNPYKGVNDCPKIGGLNKAKKAIKTADQIEAIERDFFNISFKAKRSENQRNERKVKRQLI